MQVPTTSEDTFCAIAIIIFFVLAMYVAIYTRKPPSHAITASWTKFLKRQRFDKGLHLEVAGAFLPSNAAPHEITMLMLIFPQPISPSCTKPATCLHITYNTLSAM
jgi:hypothetical protein